MNTGIAVLTLALFTGPGFAQTLAPIVAPPAAPLSVGKDVTPVPCDQIADRLTAYNHQARQQDQSVTAFLGQVTDRLNGWYATMSPLEGTPQTLAPGTFSPLKDGADQVAQITSMAFDNSDLLATEMDTLINSLKACQITHK